MEFCRNLLNHVFITLQNALTSEVTLVSHGNSKYLTFYRHYLVLLLGRFYNSVSFWITMMIVQLKYICMFTISFLPYRAGSGHYTAFAINDGRLHFVCIFI